MYCTSKRKFETVFLFLNAPQLPKVAMLKCSMSYVYFLFFLTYVLDSLTTFYFVINETKTGVNGKKLFRNYIELGVIKINKWHL